MVVRNVQDGDGGTEGLFKLVNPESECRVRLCGGHHNRAFIARLMKSAAMKSWPATQKALDEWKANGAPLPATVDGEGKPLKCHCTRHKAGCGCMSDSFLQRTRLNHTLCMSQAGNDPAKYKRLMGELADHMCGNCEGCTFHSALVCSCALKCASDDLQCDGKPYKVSYRLTCPFHAGAARRIVAETAAKADQVIDTDLGRVHSNKMESIFKCVRDFRSKEWVLRAMHYKVKTILGFLHANLYYMTKYHPGQPHWRISIMEALGLTPSDSLRKACVAEIKQLCHRHDKLTGGSSNEGADKVQYLAVLRPGTERS